MPVFPLVGSISSLPGFKIPRRSASQIIDAPMRHFTEYAGLRPSILASIVTGAPPVTRFNFTSGVRPMLSELSAKIMARWRRAAEKLRGPLPDGRGSVGSAHSIPRTSLDVPIGHVARLRFLPPPSQLREGGRVQNRVHLAVHSLPQIVKRPGSAAAGPFRCFGAPHCFTPGGFPGRPLQTAPALP